MTSEAATPGTDQALRAWLDENAVQLEAHDPTSGRVPDLREIGEMVGGARVVAIGESAHGVHQFYELKDRLLRYLVSEMGFTAFVMESGFPEGLAVNCWVRGADGDLEELLQTGITYRMGGCEEMRSQLEWMRSWSESQPERPVNFYGMDVPGSAVDGRPAADAALEFVRTVDSALADELIDTAEAALGWIEGLDGPAAVLGGYAQLDEATRNGLAAFASHLATDLATRRVTYARASTSEAAERAARCAVVLRQWEGFLASMAKGAGARDAAMAENVGWILEREERIVIGAHNGHVQRVPLGPPFPPMSPLGEHLAASLGDDLFVLGTTMKSGKVANHRETGPGPADVEMFLDDLSEPDPSTIDSLLSARGKGAYAIDLRQVPSSGPVAERFAEATAIRVNHSPVPVEPLRAFDAIVHFDEVTPVERIFFDEPEV